VEVKVHERDIMQRFVASLRRNLTPDLVVTLESCLNCRSCGLACAWFLTTEDERLHPHYKGSVVRSIYRRYATAEGRVAGLLGLASTPTTDDLRDAMDVFWKCSACGRCTLACPQGLSVRGLVRAARAAYTDAGLSRENSTLGAIIDNTRDARHSFGRSPERIYAQVGLFLHHEQVDVPIDVPGADFLFVCPAAGNTGLPDYGIKLPKILNAANVSYTISSRIIDTGTDVDHIAVHHELARRMLMEWEDEAERLGARTLLLVECGCDVRTMYVEAEQTLGRPLRFPIQSIDSLMLECIASGQIPVLPLAESVTLHDPCYVTRLSGLGDVSRALLAQVAPNLVEMIPNREYNYCCNGGSGPMRLPENAALRRKVSSLKAKQIAEARADYVTTPCAVCMLTLTDTCQHYGLQGSAGRKVLMTFELVYAAMHRALERDSSLGRVREPRLLRARSDDFMQQHSMLQGLFPRLLEDPGFPDLLRELRADPITKRYQADTPGFLSTLERISEQGVPDELRAGAGASSSARREAAAERRQW
jgi:Fe-S oxidoreductase